MRALVTGGGGFLGSAIARKLAARGDEVRSFSRSRYPELETLGIHCYEGDITDADAVRDAARGCDVVFHVAAKPGVWGPYIDYFRTNVLGTQNVIDACRRLGIRKLVHTSSPSVVFDGRDMEGVNESVPYPEHFEAAYPKTKAIAERAVLDANGSSLATVALRPHLIWGPGDNHLIPRLIARAKARQLRRIGGRNPKVDSVYVDNAADAHLLAADRLQPGAPLAGRAYFITQGEPMPVWDLVDAILKAHGLPPVKGTVPTWLAIALGGALEGIHQLLNLAREPRMTRFVARELSTAHWFDISAAKRDLGYEPRVSTAEGLRRLASFANASTSVTC
ncbi:MAG: NAD-dependent epimerase/dehydratase family protein [Planctomycetota bacterium]